MSSLYRVIEEIATVVRSVPSVVYAPTTPPANIDPLQDLPAAFIYPMSGGDTLDAHGTSVDGGHPVARSATLMIQLGLKTKGEDVQTLAAEALTAHEPLSLALMRAWILNNFNNTVPFLGLTGPSNAMPIRWQYAAFEWGGTDVLGFQYEIDVTYREEVIV